MKLGIWNILFSCTVFQFFNYAYTNPQSEFEGEKQFSPREILSEELVSGKHHSVVFPVIVDDYSYRFTVNSSFGDFEVWGGEQEVAKLVEEIEAIGELREIGNTEAFAKSLAEAVKHPVMLSWKAINNPQETIDGLPDGMSRYLKGTFFKIKKGSKKLYEKSKEAVKKSKDIIKEKELPKSSVPLGHRAKAMTIKFGKDYAGYYTATRNWAKRLQVDPYSYNTVLHEELEKIAWASAIGSYSSKYVFPSSTLISYMRKGIDMVWDYDPVEVERLNHVTLKQMGIGEKELYAFSESNGLSLTEKATITLLLRDLKNVEGRSAAFQLVLDAENMRDALFLINQLEMLVNYHKNVSPINGLTLSRGMLIGFAANGRMILPIGIEYLYWTTVVKEASESANFNARQKEILLPGSISSVAKRNLEALGWKIRNEFGSI